MTKTINKTPQKTTTKKTQKKATVPSLEQYAYSHLNQQQKAFMDPTIFRSILTKAKKTIKKPTSKQLTKKKLSLKTSPISPSVYHPATKKEIIEFCSSLKNKLSMYLQIQPNIPLNYLSNVYYLFEHGILNSKRIQLFKNSQMPLWILDNYIAGEQNVCLLFKYIKKVYLIVLKEKYPYFNRDIPEDIYDMYMEHLPVYLHPVEAFVRPLKDIHIKMALPICGSDVNISSLPFQQQSSVKLSNRT